MKIPRLPGAEWSRLYCSYRWKAFLVAPTSVFLATSYLRKLMSCFLLFFPSPHLNMPVLTAFLIRISFSESLIIFVSLFSVLFNFSSDIGYSVTHCSDTFTGFSRMGGFHYQNILRKKYVSFFISISTGRGVFNVLDFLAELREMEDTKKSKIQITEFVNII